MMYEENYRFLTQFSLLLLHDTNIREKLVYLNVGFALENNLVKAGIVIVD